MARKLTLEFAIQWTKFSTGLIFTCRPSLKATRLTKFMFAIGWWLFLIIPVLVALPLIYTTHIQRDNFMQLTASLFVTVATIQIVVKMIIGKLYHHEYQDLIERIETFVENATSHERDVLLKYVKRITPFHFTHNAITLLGCTGYALSPLAVDEPFPNVAKFPFPVNAHPVYDIMYLLEAIGGYQVGCTGGLHCLLSLFLWYWIIQLEFLAQKMRNVSSGQELKECISSHQNMLRLIKETINVVRPPVITTVVMLTMTIACGGIHIVGNEPVIKKVSFVAIIISFSLGLFCISWAAENLTTACEQVGWALYDSPWIRQSKEFNKVAIIVMQRCQNPPILGIGGLLPKLSLNYYATYMSATYSFFTALHVMLKKFENGS